MRLFPIGSREGPLIVTAVSFFKSLKVIIGGVQLFSVILTVVEEGLGVS